jgi:hypothetical protein
MATKDLSELKEIFKQAAEIAKQVPNNMQEAAFNRALSLLTGQAERLDSSTPPLENEMLKNKARSIKKSAKKNAKKGAKTKAKSVVPERFDVHKSDNQPSLKDFLDEKKPGENTGNVIATIAYYIICMRKKPSFTEGNIDYAYRTVPIKGRPKHLRQIIINNKNQRDLFEEADEENWKLTRTGEIFVEEELPPQD